MRRSPGVDPQRGSTLAEVLVAIVILSIAGVAIVSGMASASLASDTHRKEVTADTVVRSYANVIKQRAQLGFYVPCAAPLAYTAHDGRGSETLQVIVRTP